MKQYRVMQKLRSKRTNKMYWSATSSWSKDKRAVLETLSTLMRANPAEEFNVVCLETFTPAEFLKEATT